MNAVDDLGRIQFLELNVLKEFAAICDRHHLIYYLSEGTLLGAVRHHGFIPWDDDVDVCMPREDYEIFAEVARAELPEYMNIVYFRYSDDDTKDMTFFMHPYDSRYSISWKRECDKDIETLPVWIDVTPLDGLPKRRMSNAVHHVRMKTLGALTRCSDVRKISTDRKLALSKRIVIFLANKLRMDKLNTKKCYEKFDDAAKRYPFKSADRVINYGSEYRTKDGLPKEWYGGGRMVKFEDTELRIPTEAEKILTQEYGDYMTLPPEDNRKPRHIYLIDEHANGGGYSLKVIVNISAFILQSAEDSRRIA